MKTEQSIIQVMGILFLINVLCAPIPLSGDRLTAEC